MTRARLLDRMLGLLAHSKADTAEGYTARRTLVRLLAQHGITPAELHLARRERASPDSQPEAKPEARPSEGDHGSGQSQGGDQGARPQPTPEQAQAMQELHRRVMRLIDSAGQVARSRPSWLPEPVTPGALVVA